ncbi:uncharacterized protein LOC123312849 [Coccinella septempunctata]|uniref:uncharacterized protein LOC123312849 n=1 Tax=Coccinella septempunctata TaxID=41139 RepID=UPI001D073F2E|nr:uncharacterized protein LOC123312849 [Coccinella septempunctata]
MYRPPENTNRVKSIKSKFENIENSNCTKENLCSKNGTRDNVTNTKSDSKTLECSALPLNLQRQLSDPSKRNIKRTPAFRLDKNSDKVAAFQRSSVLNKSQEVNPNMKPVSTKKVKDCDKIVATSEILSVKKTVPSLLKENKPILLKSKSSMDFNVLRNKFNSVNSDSGTNDSTKESNQRNDSVMKNVSALYTEPIPKSLRIKPCDKTVMKPIYSNLEEIPMKNESSDDSDIHKVKTLRLTDKEQPINHTSVSASRKITLTNKVNGLHDKLGCAEKDEKSDTVNKNDKDELASALKKLDTLLQMTKSNSLKKAQTSTSTKHIKQELEMTDTLKNALKKPLPTGPAPKKPPRTFAHCSTGPNIEENNRGSFDNFEKNISFLHVSKHVDTEVREPLCLKDKSNLKRNDPKYMLNKLESALRNNKLKTRKSAKTDMSTTSGEDSDDSALRNGLNIRGSSQNRTLLGALPSVPDNSSPNIPAPTNNMLVQALNFNCLNGNTNCISSPPYSKLIESKSSFFVSVKNDEPVYAEPWQFEEIFRQKNGSRQRSISSDRNTKNNRNSLYYWSSPVLCSTPCSSSSSSMNLSSKQTDVPSTNLKCRSEKDQQSEVSSLSSFNSESASSTPMDDIEKPFPGTVNIKQLIDTFETKTNTKKQEENDVTLTNNTINKNSDVGELDSIPKENGQGAVEEIGEKNSRLDAPKTDIHKDMDDSFDPNETSLANVSDRKMSYDDPTVDKFRTYVRNVSVYAKIRPQSKKSTLFECCLIVEWNADVRRIKFKYPHNVQVPHKIEDLCFPDAACGPLDKTLNAQCYSLVITDDRGERTFGYCRRVVPEGSNKCLPIAYCILSKHKSPRFYKKILIELESRHGISEKHRNNLLEAFYYNKFPQPGETVVIKLADSIGCGRNKENFSSIKEDDERCGPDIIENNRSDTIKKEDDVNRSSLEDSIESSFVIVNDKGEYESLTKRKKEMVNNSIAKTSIDFLDMCGENEIVLNVHEDPIYENSDLKDLHELPTEILRKIFASLLLERKVILISCLLSKLSSCVEALQTIIYPFTWPHSFIPVLPKSLWEFVEAPTPIICGILSVEVLNKHDIEHGIVVDLDEKCIWKEEGDEDKALSSSMLRAWRKHLEAAKSIPVDEEAHSFYLTDAYIHMFSVALKNYRDYIVNGNFQREAFIRSAKRKGVRRFLNWFTESSMFLTFVDSVITNSQDFSQFDKKIAMYASEQSVLILDKILDWKF